MSEPQECPMNDRDDQSIDRLPCEPPAELKAIEARLAALSPRDDRLDRERLMFLAGRASVERPFEIGNRKSRAWLESKAWPAAFAGMTAVAAALLVALVVRPIDDERTALQVVSDGDHVTLRRPIVDRDLPTNGDVLSPSDARRGDIEALVYSAPHVAVDAAIPRRGEQDRATLTPGAWRQIIEEADVLRPNSNDSSDIRILQGITS
jgi:hypothetical protein